MGLGLALCVCISNKHPGEANATGPWITLVGYKTKGKIRVGRVKRYVQRTFPVKMQNVHRIREKRNKTDFRELLLISLISLDCRA